MHIIRRDISIILKKKYMDACHSLIQLGHLPILTTRPTKNIIIYLQVSFSTIIVTILLLLNNNYNMIFLGQFFRDSHSIFIL